MTLKEEKEIIKKLMAEESAKIAKGKRLSNDERKQMILKVQKLMREKGYRP